MEKQLDKSYETLFESFLGKSKGLSYESPKATFLIKEPVWLLGKQYITDVIREFKSIIWMTYRKDFTKISNSTFTSDIGWGCTLRSGQMIMANILKRIGIYHEKQILEWFLDIPSLRNPFSIHNMLVNGYGFDKKIGEWFGPHATCTILKRCAQTWSEKNNFTFYINNNIYYDQFLTKNEWTPTIIFISAMLGVEKFNPNYIPSLKSILEFPQNVGIIGGKSKSSFYFVGYQDNKLLYLDPHTIQPAISKIESIDSFYCQNILLVDIETIDPSLTIGFYCETYESLQDFFKRIEDQKEFEYCVLNVNKSTPKYDEEWKDQDDYLLI